jgi:hypothetical protein
VGVADDLDVIELLGLLLAQVLDEAPQQDGRVLELGVRACLERVGPSAGDRRPPTGRCPATDARVGQELCRHQVRRCTW